MNPLCARHRPSHVGHCVLICAVALSIFGTEAAAQEAGYDENTEIVLAGQVFESHHPPHLGLECFTLKSHSRLYRIVTAPPWFMRGINLRLKMGHKIEVIGSKFYGRDGLVYVLARSLRFVPAGQTVVLRDKACRPVWRSSGCSESSCLNVSHPVQ
jgi:hypothetical protein